jgi:hypothetical protein
MSVTIIKISANKLPKGGRLVSDAQQAKANKRLRKIMISSVRENQKKQRKSLERASKTVLNA